MADLVKKYNGGLDIQAPEGVKANGVNVLTSDDVVTYQSTDQTIPAGNVELTVNHGLGSTPRDWSMVLKCVTAEHGFSAGDEVAMTGHVDGDGARRWTSWANATQLGFVLGVTQPYVVSRTTWAIAAITPANWKIVFRATK